MSTSQLSRILMSHAGVSKHVQKSQMARLKKSNPRLYNKVVKAQAPNSLLPTLRGEMSAHAILWTLSKAHLRQKSRALQHWHRTMVTLEHESIVTALRNELADEKENIQRRDVIIHQQKDELEVMRLKLSTMNAAEQEHNNRVCRRVCIRLLKSKLNAGWNVL